MVMSSSSRATGLILSTLAVTAVAISVQSATGPPRSARSKAFYADKNLVAFVRPGLVITVNSAEVAGDGTISTTFTVADPMGAPLDCLVSQLRVRSHSAS